MMKLIIFDLDGTLLDTAGDLAGALEHTLEAHSLPGHSIPEYKRMIGRGMRNLVKSALPPECLQDDFVDSFLKEFLDWYLSHIDCRTIPYPGIVKLLDDLNASGFRIAVASNKLQAGTDALIRGFFPGIPFVAICGNGPDYPLKPDAALVQYIMDKAGATADDTVMVGDSGIDILTAKNAGIKSIAVSWGFRPLEDLQGADFIVDSAEEILKIGLE